MKDNKQRLLTVLFAKPEYHFHIRELAREAKLHPNTVIALTDQLAKEGIILKEKYKHLVEVYCNSDSEVYRRSKKIFNLARIHESGILDFIINFYHNPKAIILFGSYSRGEDHSQSDLDIAIITTNKNNPKVSSFEKELHRKIHVLTLEYKDISPEFYNNLINGIVLYGYLKDERLSILPPREKST